MALTKAFTIIIIILTTTLCLPHNALHCLLVLYILCPPAAQLHICTPSVALVIRLFVFILLYAHSLVHIIYAWLHGKKKSSLSRSMHLHAKSEPSCMANVGVHQLEFIFFIS